MITIKIGENERTYPFEPRWLADQFKNRRKENAPICIRVSIRDSDADVNVNLRAGNCKAYNGSAAGSPRPLKPKEARIIELWQNQVKNKSRLSPGILQSFFRKLKSLL